jgi:hypothetical protein
MPDPQPAPPPEDRTGTPVRDEPDPDAIPTLDPPYGWR